ncbi:MAG: protein-glutamate O-methyltransferase CheR [Firmicutes bacterium]|nr:protein-glutamate O-methyltransferase CheR [Bacillota bacterium]
MRAELYGICHLLGFKDDAAQVDMLASRVERLTGGRKPTSINDWITCVTIKETRFFRDINQFQALETFLKQRLASGSKTVRMWSAGCSFGQEPYSMAIVAKKACDGFKNNIGVEVLASDIDTGALEIAAEGVYPIESLWQIPEEYRKYVLPEGNQLRIKDIVKCLVQFFSLNLAGMDPYPKDLDVVFCRNVLIYFNPQAALSAIRRIHASLRPGGLLFLGEGETISYFGLYTLFEAIDADCLVYKKLQCNA